MQLEAFERIKSRNDYLAVVGLGYVGLPIAVAFADKVKTIGFDIDQEKIAVYQQGRQLWNLPPIRRVYKKRK